jgi:hypothetical protein
MKGLLFLSRLALICNTLFVACLVFQHTPELGLPQGVKGTVVVLGWILPLFINFSVIIAYLINAIRKKVAGLPAWLIITNILFFIAQVLIQIVFA